MFPNEEGKKLELAMELAYMNKKDPRKKKEGKSKLTEQRVS